MKSEIPVGGSLTDPGGWQLVTALQRKELRVEAEGTVMLKHSRRWGLVGVGRTSVSVYTSQDLGAGVSSAWKTTL